MRNILLLHPRTDRRYSELNVGYLETPPPLGLIILSNVLRSQFPDVHIRILDGNYVSIGKIKKIVESNRFDLVGLSDWFTNHENCLEIARHAKAVNPNSEIVLGGPNAGHLAPQILNNHNTVDYVVANDGEEAIKGLVAARPTSQIPNLYYRFNGSIKFTYAANTNLNDLPLLDFDFEDLTHSLTAYDSRRQEYQPDFLTPFPISSVRGCIKAVTSGRCAYCSIPGDKVKVTKPERFWEQVSFLNRKYGIEYFFETGDDFTVGSYPERLLAAKPANLRVRFRIYTQPVNVNKRNVEIFRELGVSDIFMGVENVDYEILKRSNKPYDTARLYNMLDLLRSYDIQAHLAFLFGLPNETEKTAQRNFNEVFQIVSQYEVTVKRILFSLAVPIVGSDWFNRLRADPEVQQQYRALTATSLTKDDNLDYAVLTKLFVRKYCTVDYDWLLNTIERGEKLIAENLGRARLTTFGNINRLSVAPEQLLRG